MPVIPHPRNIAIALLLFDAWKSLIEKGKFLSFAWSRLYCFYHTSNRIFVSKLEYFSKRSIFDRWNWMEIRSNEIIICESRFCRKFSNYFSIELSEEEWREERCKVRWIVNQWRNDIDVVDDAWFARVAGENCEIGN